MSMMAKLTFLFSPFFLQKKACKRRVMYTYMYNVASLKYYCWWGIRDPGKSKHCGVVFYYVGSNVNVGWRTPTPRPQYFECIPAQVEGTCLNSAAHKLPSLCTFLQGVPKPSKVPLLEVLRDMFLRHPVPFPVLDLDPDSCTIALLLPGECVHMCTPVCAPELRLNSERGRCIVNISWLGLGISMAGYFEQWLFIGIGNLKYYQRLPMIAPCHQNFTVLLFNKSFTCPMKMYYVDCRQSSKWTKFITPGQYVRFLTILATTAKKVGEI